MSAQEASPAAQAYLPGLSALEVVSTLGLEPHPEGGYFRETYRSSKTIQTEAGERPVSTSILYLITENGPSHFHRLRADEVWFYHAGSPLEMVLLTPPGLVSPAEGESGPGGSSVASLMIGPLLPQAIVPARSWMGARVVVADEADWGAGRKPERRWTKDRRSTREHRWTLAGCVVSPGFHYEDFELGDRETLLRAFPQARRAIEALT